VSEPLRREIARYRALAEEAMASVAAYPAERFEGRGIVICASGLRYFTCAWICVRMLQRFGCALPVEFWALDENGWTPEMERLAREELGVSDCRLARGEDRERFTDPWAESAGRAGWELKPYAIIESRFREVLLLDADIVPVADPTFLFDSPQLAEHGAIFWPDPASIGPERAAWRSWACRIARRCR
jgi:alpha 1,2-mannosyltransferase